MSEQALDVRRFVQIMRRRRMLICIVAILGLLLGAAFAVMSPPKVSSRALVALPRSTPSMATQVVIATSDPVLIRALPSVRPAMSLDTLRNVVQAKSVTSYLVAITAKGATAADAEATANAVASSYIAYVSSSSSPVGHVLASTLQPATTATGTSLVKQVIVDGVLGLIVGALIGIIVALAVSRADRRLIIRDEIANSIGLPVLASLPVGHPADAAGWTKLLDDYQPGAMHAWRLRNALKELGMMGMSGGEGTGSSLTILSLSSDPGAFALGPQLAVFAASLGIPTALVIGQQDAAATAMLRTACSVPPAESSNRPSRLRVTVSNGNRDDRHPEAALTVVVAVIDGRAPKLPDTMRTTATVLGVSAGVTTAEQLARAAVTAAADGREIAGILVADPDPGDNTTGRMPHLIKGSAVPTVRVLERHSDGDRRRSIERYNSAERRGSADSHGGLARNGNGSKPASDSSDETVIFSARIDESPAHPTTEIRR